MKMSLVTEIWNGEKYNFPWRETILGALGFCFEAIVVVPACEDDTAAKANAWSLLDPRITVLNAPAVKGSKEIAEVVDRGIKQASGDFVLHIQADEVLECGPWFEVALAPYWALMLDQPLIIGFPRLDFTCSASHVTPIFPTEPSVARLMARRWYPQLHCEGDAMHLGGLGAQHEALPGPPIFHYHGLADEGGWQEKETEFQELYHDVGLPVDQNLKLGWQAWFKDGKTSRARRLQREHPLVVRPWLVRSEMYLRDALLGEDPAEGS